MFLTCILTMITGGTALVTVPAMIWFGIPPRTALAINMVILTFMSVGGLAPFLRRSELDRGRAPLFIGVTAMGSALGANLVFAVPAEVIPLIIPVAMIAVLLFLLMNPRAGLRRHVEPSRNRMIAGYGVMFLLAIYGGFFSGGYVTLLIAASVFFFDYPFLQAMVMSRVMNLASASIATSVFAWHGAVPWRIAVMLGCFGFAGAMVGSLWAKRAPEKLLRIVFVSAVALLAIKSLIVNVPWSKII